MSRRLPIGAELSEWRGIHFRVCAPSARRVDVVLESGASATSLEPEPDGYHRRLVEAASVGACHVIYETETDA